MVTPKEADDYFRREAEEAMRDEFDSIIPPDEMYCHWLPQVVDGPFKASRPGDKDDERLENDRTEREYLRRITRKGREHG